MTDTELQLIAKQAQDYYQAGPAIILGSGASAAFGMSGMGKLATHLTSTITVADGEPSDVALWKDFCKLLNAGVDLETALHSVSLSPCLSKQVVQATWGLLNPEDLNVFYQSINTRHYFPLGKLLSHLFRSTKSSLDIITTNYDRLAEYACEQEGLHHYTGFTHGYRRFAVNKNHLKAERQVNIWKVHGSLDWFIKGDRSIVCLGNVDHIPDGLSPLIVTPGLEKYRNTHKEPFKSIIHASDDVLDVASSYLCVGFGFNDEHIQQKLVNRCHTNAAKVTVVTYALSQSARSFLLSGELKNFLAIERGSVDDESIAYSSTLAGPKTVGGDFWSLSGFIKLVA